MYRVIAMGTRTNVETITGYHAHDYWEFVYYYSGRGTILYDGQELDFHPNMLVCSPPGVVHAELSSGVISNTYFMTDAPIQIPNDKCYICDDKAGDLEYIFRQLHFHYFRRRGNWQEIIHSLLSLFGELIVLNKDYSRSESYVTIAENIIINNFTNKDFKLNDIFEEIPMAKEYFMSLFRQSTGMTLLEYLTDRRIENAKQLLYLNDNRRTTVREVAEMSGFSDVYYFSRVFKKKTGLSPLNWIKQNHRPKNTDGA